MPSHEHADLARRCPRWLRGRITRRGLRGGFEVPLAIGYTADYVALCGFQDRYLRLYVKQDQFDYDGVVRINPEFACVFEVKRSRADFSATFGKSARSGREFPEGSLHWVVTPPGLIQVAELPKGWGWLCRCGPGLHQVVRPRFWPKKTVDLHAIGYYLLWYGKEEPAETKRRRWERERRWKLEQTGREDDAG